MADFLLPYLITRGYCRECRGDDLNHQKMNIRNNQLVWWLRGITQNHTTARVPVVMLLLLYDQTFEREWPKVYTLPAPREQCDFRVYHILRQETYHIGWYRLSCSKCIHCILVNDALKPQCSSKPGYHTAGYIPLYHPFITTMVYPLSSTIDSIYESTTILKSC